MNPSNRKAMYAKNSINNFNIEFGNNAGYTGVRQYIIPVIKKDVKREYRKKGIEWKQNGKHFMVKDIGHLSKEQLAQQLNNESRKGNKKYHRVVFVNGKNITKDYQKPDYIRMRNELRKEGKLRFD
jgi:hypothetical protein